MTVQTYEEYKRWGAQAEVQFGRARRHAFIETLIGRFTRRTTELVPFGAVQRTLELRSVHDRGLQDIPIDKIVGSVGKCGEFTRSLWPRHNSSKERWKRIYALTHGIQGLPPIDVYKVGEVYFIIDGHHRASVARQLGIARMQAHVTDYVSPVVLTVENVDAVVAETRRRSTPDIFPPADTRRRALA